VAILKSEISSFGIFLKFKTKKKKKKREKKRYLLFNPETLRGKCSKFAYKRLI
jgi:hypothetical protein